jgi:glycerol-3-phosphate acyltransferase PlsY
MTAWLYVLPVLAYFYGSIPFGFLAARWLRGVDIRTVGSGNIGATNAARVLGFKYFPVIFLLDMTKGFLPSLIAASLVPDTGHDPSPWTLAAGFGGVLGHVFPVYLKFKGGKAVAAGTGMFLVAVPWAVAVAAGVWAVVFALWRYVSLASICAALSLPVGVAMVHEPFGKGAWGFGLALVAALFITWLHRTNIARLRAGTEHKIGSGGKAPDRRDGEDAPEGQAGPGQQ